MGREQASRVSNYPKNVNNHCSESWFLLSLVVGERQSRSKKVESDQRSALPTAQSTRPLLFPFHIHKSVTSGPYLQNFSSLPVSAEKKVDTRAKNDLPVNICNRKSLKVVFNIQSFNPFVLKIACNLHGTRSIFQIHTILWSIGS